MKEEKYKQYFATIIFVFSIFFLLYTAYNFINGFFGALLLYIILKPFFKFLSTKKINKKLAAIIVVCVAFFIIVIPILFMMGIVGNEILNIFENPDAISNLSKKISETVTEVLPTITEEVLFEKLNNIINSLLSLFLGAFSSAGSFLINLFIALFLLYYMLIEKNLYGKLEDIIPFGKKNSRELIKKMQDISYSTVFVGLIIALIQGGLLMISFFLFGVPKALLWGFITAILSFVPLVGPPFVWIPAVIILFFQGKTFAAIGVLIFGLVLSNIDNLIRPYLGEKLSKIHPLVTFIGIFIGVALFGIIGLFLGPLLIALSLLIIRMFKEKYIH